MDELTLRDYLKVLFRQKWVIIAAIITVTVTVAIGLMLKTKTYEASVKMLVSAQKQVESPYYSDLMGSQNMSAALTQSEIVKSNPVMERTLKAIGLKPLDFEKKFASPLRQLIVDRQVASINKELDGLVSKISDRKTAENQKQAMLFRIALEDLKRRVKVEPVRDTNLFTISYSDFDPGIAAAIANIISRSYVIFDLEQQLAELQMKYGDKNLAVTQLKDSITKMEQNLNGQPLPNIEAIGPASVKIVEQAIPPIRPSGLPKPLLLMLAAVMSILLGIMLAFGFDYMDQTFKSPQEIENTLGIAYLGSVPKKANPLSYQDVADQIYLTMKDKGLKSLLITSALPSEGVSSMAANIAISISRKIKHRILVIDANLRAPAMNKIFKLPEGQGLSGVLENRVELTEAIREGLPSLDVLTAGKTALNPAMLFGSRRMQDIIVTAAGAYEMVVIDCGNLKDSKDAIALLSYVNTATIVINEGKTRKQTVKSALALFEQKKANILGAILNNRTFVIPKVIYEKV